MRYMAGPSGSHSRVSSVPDLKLVLPQCESISKLKEKSDLPDGYNVAKLFPQFIPVLREKRDYAFQNKALLQINRLEHRRGQQTSTPYLSKQIATHSRSSVKQEFDSYSRNDFLHSLGRITSCSSSQNSVNKRSSEDKNPLNSDLQAAEIKVEDSISRGARRVVF